MQILIEDTKKLAQKAGEELSKALEKNKGKDILLMLSGGSAFKVLEHVDTETLSDKITISAVDERFSMDPEVNNFSQIEQTDFFDACLEKECAIIGTRIHKTETLPAAVMNFDGQLQRWHKACPKGVVIALLGIGEDAHTAGVFPFPESKRLFDDLFLDEEWVASFDATGKHEHTLRFTVTLTFLKENVDHAVVYAQGAKKKDALQKIADTSLEIHEVPAKIFNDMKDVVLFTDQEIS